MCLSSALLLLERIKRYFLKLFHKSRLIKRHGYTQYLKFLNSNDLYFLLSSGTIKTLGKRLFQSEMLRLRDRLNMIYVFQWIQIVLYNTVFRRWERYHKKRKQEVFVPSSTESLPGWIGRLWMISFQASSLICNINIVLLNLK